MRLSIVSKFTVLVLVFSVFTGSSFIAPVQAAEQKISESHTYIVKLNSGEGSQLNSVGKNVSEKFVFSTQEKFNSVYSFQSDLDLEQLRQSLAGQFEYLEEDKTVSAGAVETEKIPDDPGVTKNESNIDRQWGLVKAEFLPAWKLTTGKKSVVVAVIDTGIDATHEDIGSGRLVKGYNFVADKEITKYQNSDDNGHGTLVAGVIGARTNNTMGIAGSAWEVSLMPLKALNSRGSGTSSNLSQAIVWAADKGADVINLSLGGLGFAHNNTLANAISYAYDKGVVIIAAAGNDVAVTGGNLDNDPVYPICHDNGKNMIIGVTATDEKDLKPNFANYGKTCVDVSAPGKRILSTINHDPATNGPSPDSYAYASGTSLAVPYVSGQAALLKSLYPSISNSQIRDRIISTSDSIDALNLSQCAGKSCAGYLGKGRINVLKSLETEFASFKDGDVVRISGTETLYYINGGKRQLITQFVRNQRFPSVTPKTVSLAELVDYPEGSYAEPKEGTLIKASNDGAVYYISKGVRLPVALKIFQLHGFKFADVVTLPSNEVNSWLVGSFLAPPEGTLIKSNTDQTVYWTVNGSLHPINHTFWVQRGLNIFPVVILNDFDLKKFSIGDPYIL